MSILMVYDRDDMHPVSSIDLAVSYKKGYVVEVFDEADTGYSSAAPFVLLTISDKIQDEMSAKYLSKWIRTIDFAVVTYAIETDYWLLSMFVSNPGISGVGAADNNTVIKVEDFIHKWGGSNISVVDQSLQFNIGVYSVATSEKFWKCNVSRIAFTELSYDQTSGVHIISADYSDLLNLQEGPTSEFMNNNLSSNDHFVNDLNIISHVGTVITFYVHRNAMIVRFENDLRDLSQDVVCRRRYHFSSDGVDAVISGGRTFTVATEAELSPYIIDKTI